MFIKEHRKDYPIGIICRLLSVSRSSYHLWIKRKLAAREFENRRLLEIIWFHHNKSKATYGLPRIYAAIRKEGLFVNKKESSQIDARKQYQG